MHSPREQVQQVKTAHTTGIFLTFKSLYYSIYKTFSYTILEFIHNFLIYVHISYITNGDGVLPSI